MQEASPGKAECRKSEKDVAWDLWIFGEGAEKETQGAGLMRVADRCKKRG